ncbi:Crp/Fnr family transcriptional regulator [Alkalilimnicola ehrlichii MLHE-1]|uniref:Cyclic nucleotide-binding protein n=1 Tax=Alkalilimnicola ehrlichii (strain ATCC BAA-1101 / DSM 17681 / MLHE-1) TaxID=187272 RepID=Q0A9F6_ALKEH|nr:Crp/Fnr family transcriptional regulator [Alkalilimnicola ehrlichii]ABI56531.1 cyclic nucleotide-binding protein [Alkalilimnicola ehrlichii MLHE-1]
MTKAAIKQFLADQDFFSDFDNAVLDLLAEHASEISLDKDEVLFSNGDPARHFYLLKDGNIVIEVPAIEGPTLEVQSLTAGQVLGWSWLIPPYRWTFQARAEAPTRLVEFEGEVIRQHCEKDPRLGYAILKHFASLMSERLDAARRKMMDEWNPPGFA